MSVTPGPVAAHVKNAKEHLAGIKAAQVWRQDLVAQHLLDTQQPIKDTPVAAPTGGGQT